MTLQPASAPPNPPPQGPLAVPTKNGQSLRTHRPPARWSPQKRFALSFTLLALLGSAGAASWKFFHDHGRDRPDLVLYTVKREMLVQTIIEKGEMQSANNHDIYCTVNHEALTGSKTSIKWVI